MMRRNKRAEGRHSPSHEKNEKRICTFGHGACLKETMDLENDSMQKNIRK